MPPRELPGFYFDAERNRYFPLTSRPPPNPSGNNSPSVNSTPKVQDSEPYQSSRRRRALWTCPARETTSAGRAREVSAVRHTRLAATSRGCSESVRWPFVGAGQRICAFQTTPTHQFLGDAHGWLHSRVHNDTPSSDVEDMDRWTPWTPELSLAPHSEISALCTTNTRCVAVCFDVTTKICVQDAAVPDRTQLLHLSTVRDVRAASLQDRALVLGAADKAVLITDLDASNNAVRMLPARSDVFAVAHQGTLIYAGTRAGTVLRFDTRVNNSKGTQVLFESGRAAGRSSAVFVQPTHGGEQLVLGYMDGRLGSYDLRFARPGAQPVVSYAGHPSSLSYNGRLGLALDPDERFLFAAGADHRLRAWALDSGAPVVPPTPPPSSPSSYPAPENGTNTSRKVINPFATLFTTPFASLQVVDADDGPGQVLWAGGGSEVWCWRLGL
ncbi:hypothetical protein C8R45DRAFT_967513 [Mycena sanguinolenta]|nr:hypothetical protein C8R45DRAFT_967513 [Mycena sanguinolenta]